MDKHKFAQVIRNLLSNAIKFSSRGAVVSVHIGFQIASPRSSHSNHSNPRPSVIAGVVDALFRRRTLNLFNPNPLPGGNAPAESQAPALSNQQLQGDHHVHNNSAETRGTLVVKVSDKGPGISKVSNWKSETLALPIGCPAMIRPFTHFFLIFLFIRPSFPRRTRPRCSTRLSNSHRDNCRADRARDWACGVSAHQLHSLHAVCSMERLPTDGVFFLIALHTDPEAECVLGIYCLSVHVCGQS